MSDDDLKNIINSAKPGISKYLAIMDKFHAVDVSVDDEFQTMFKGFYRVRQKPASWYRAYFALMQQLKGSRPTFDTVLDSFRAAIGNNVCEASFSSKLVATLDPWQPIWDKYVLANTGHKPPASAAPDKFAQAKAGYASIAAWYATFLADKEGKRWIQAFNDNVDQYWRLTDIKKVDFILWQSRDEAEG